MSTLTVSPMVGGSYLVLATLASHAIHGSPNQETFAGITQVRRQKQLIQLPPEDATSPPFSQEALDGVLRALPVPAMLQNTFAPLEVQQFLAVSLVAQFIFRARSAEGEGLFSGEERYHWLNWQVVHAARRCRTLPAYWSDLCASLQVDGASRPPAGIIALLALPRRAALPVLMTLEREAAACILLAREWVEAVKGQNPTYAAAASREPVPQEMVTLAYDVTSFPPVPKKQAHWVPWISTNAVRHVLVREPAMWHLLDRLQIALGELSPAVGTLLGNGGRINEGAKALDVQTRARLGLQVRQHYPSLELLGGSVDTFLLPESTLRVNAWLVCLENAEVLASFGVAPEYSAEALIDTQGSIRQSVSGGISTGRFSFETIASGAELALQFTLTKNASSLAKGALAAALRTAADRPHVGGHEASGFGRLILHLPESQDLEAARQQYEAYLEANRPTLRAGLLDGTLGTPHVLCAASSRSTSDAT